MKLIFFSLIIIFFFISITQEDIIDVTAQTGIINKNFDSDNNIFSFDIESEVNKNITNNITKIDIFLRVQEYGSSQIMNALCFLLPVRVYEDSNSTTQLKCAINLTESQKLNKESNLKIESGPIQGPTETSITLNFHKFDDISIIINVGDLTLKYLDEEVNHCSNNHFLFEISSNIERAPLQSTICKVSISEDQNHTEANCAIPFYGNKIICYVDVSQKKYVRGDKIIINAQDLVPCENGQNIKIINDAKNKLEIKEECGEIINNKSKYFYISEILLFFLLLIIF